MAFEWVETFLSQLAISPNVSAAAKAAGIARQYAYEVKAADPEFAAAWDDAVDQSTDSLVGEMYRRARDGVDEPVFHQGEVCGHKRRFSDTLAIFLAKAHRPDVYGDKITHAADAEAPLSIVIRRPDAPQSDPDPGD